MSYGGFGQGNNDPFADVGGYGAPGAPHGQPYPQGQMPPQGAGYPPQSGGLQPGFPPAPGFAPQQGYPPAYGHGGPQGPTEPENDNRLFGLLAIAFGLLGFVLAFIEPIYILGAVIAAIGVIFAFASLAKEPTSKGFAITGLIAGFAGLVVAVIWLLIGILSR